MLKDTKILVTGGAGFIGSHIVTRLAEANQVLIYDIFSTGREENIAHLKDNPNVEVLRIDIRDASAVEKHMQGVEYVFHLAAVASVPQSVADPAAANEHNVTGTMNILLAARENNVKKIVFSTSAAVYGDEPTLPKTESMQTMPKSPYAVTKIAGENYCRVFYENYGLPTVALRYFNVYGPRQDPSSDYATVVPKFIQRAAAGEPPIIFGDGEQSRDFVYIDDVVDANIQAAITSSADGEIFNIASGSPTTVNTLAKTITELSGKTIAPVHQPAREGDIIHSYADISKAKSILGWSPSNALNDGLKCTFDFFNDDK